MMPPRRRFGERPGHDTLLTLGLELPCTLILGELGRRYLVSNWVSGNRVSGVLYIPRLPCRSGLCST